MKNSEKMVEAYFMSLTKRAIFASFSNLRNANTENDESFSDFVLDIRNDEMFRAAKKSGVNLTELVEEIFKCYEHNSKELLSKLSKALALAVDESKQFERKKKEEKK